MTQIQRITILLALAALAATIGQAAGTGVAPNEAERAALAQLKGRIFGEIVWESNRTGQWELYAMNADGTGARRLTDLGGLGTRYDGYLRPRISPDGKLVLFAYGKVNAPVETWVVPADGGEPRKLATGSPLNWSADSKAVFLVREWQLLRHEVATGEEAVIYSGKLPTDGKSGGTVGAVRADLKAVVVRSPRTNEYFLMESGKTEKTMGGCEPRFSADGRCVYWVQGPQDFRMWDSVTNEEHQLLGKPDNEPHNYTYFPTVSADGRWILCGASPGQHDHTTSDYEVLLQELKDWKPIGKPIRLTFNQRTDRWPNLHVAPASSPDPLPDGPYDVAGNRLTNPPPPPLAIFTFPSENAKPDFGGEWGLWPQLDGCRATATFVAEDAEGRKGGSMKIDYTIESDPRSFSLWMTPAGNGRVDLSDYDRFVIYARGSVPSFTLVVKDRNAGDPDAPDGIADCVVTGVTDQWQRFELPFADFAPRKQGARVDWPTINHVGIALIQPQNAPKGTLQVDNLQALAAGPADRG